jgi:hypothetical protein
MLDYRADEIPSAVQLVHNLRFDLISASLSAETEVIQEDLLIHSLGATDLVEALRSEGADPLPELMQVVSRSHRPDELLSILRDGPDDLYLNARKLLRRTRDARNLIRDRFDEIRAGLSPQMRTPLEEHLEDPIEWDAREPCYNHEKCLAGLTAAISDQTAAQVYGKL